MMHGHMNVKFVTNFVNNIVKVDDIIVNGLSHENLMSLLRKHIIYVS